MISINYQDSRPIYEQIVSGYQKLIFRGVLRPDDAELERQGFIYTVRGRGNFVCGDPRLIETKQKELLTVIEKALLEAGEIGLDPEEVLRQAAEGYRKRQA